MIEKQPHLPQSTAIISIVSAVAVFIHMAGTQWGVGTSPDSIRYISAAESIHNSQGLGEIGSHYPPLYPIMIWAFGILGENFYSAARTLQALVFAGNVILIGLILHRLTGKYLYVLFGTLLFTTSPYIYTLHIYALTEGAFFLFTFGGMYFLTTSPKKNKATGFFIAILFISLSSLTRYAGVATILSCAIYLLIYNKNKQKIQGAYFIFASSLPLIIWLSRNLVLHGNPTNRALTLHVPSPEKINDAISTTLNWFQFPENGGAYLLILLVAMGLVFTMAIRNTSGDNPAKEFYRLLLVFAFTYIAFIAFSLSFVDALTPLDFRILSPLFMAVIFILSSLPALLDKKDRFHTLAYWLTIIVIIILGVRQTISLKPYVHDYVDSGAGFSSRQWAESRIIKNIASLPDDMKIYSNAPEVISIYTGRKSFLVPRVIIPSQNKPNPTFNSKIKEMEESMWSKNGVYVHFHAIQWRWYLPDLDSLVENMELTPIYEAEDGVILINK